MLEAFVETHSCATNAQEWGTRYRIERQAYFLDRNTKSPAYRSL
jgi:hypothetical protein